jgi:hypothetical protein
MRALKQSTGSRCGAKEKQRGAAAIEFALVVMIYLLFVFGLIEIARAMYICNTLQEVTRRAAAAAVNKDFSDPAALKEVQAKAIFREDAGMLVFGDPITDAHIRIDYMYLARTGSALKAEPITAMPSDPATNRLNCATDPNGSSCIRLVRVRLCEPAAAGATACGAVPYKPIVSLIPIRFNLPPSTTIMTAETLGSQP